MNLVKINQFLINLNGLKVDDGSTLVHRPSFKEFNELKEFHVSNRHSRLIEEKNEKSSLPVSNKWFSFACNSLDNWATLIPGMHALNQITHRRSTGTL